MALQQAPRRLALLNVLLWAEHQLHPRIDLFSALPLEPEIQTGCNEPPNPFQTQLLCLLRADIHFSTCLTLQAHLVLEETVV